MSSKNGKRTGSAHKILVTGGFGFLGTHLIKALRKKYPKAVLYVASRRTHRPAPLRKARIILLKGDLKKTSFWKRLPRDLTHIIHLAAFIDRGGSMPSGKILKENLLPARNLARFASKAASLKQIVYSSSVSVYKPSLAPITEKTPVHPVGAYGRSKFQGERILSKIPKKGLKVACLRFSSLYGPGQYTKTVLPVMMAHARQSGRITVFGAGRRRQDFLHARDAAKAVCLVVGRRAEGVFNIGSGKACSMKELASKIKSVSGRDVRITFDKSKREDGPGYTLMVKKAKSQLGFSPGVSLLAGLKEAQKGRR